MATAATMRRYLNTPDGAVYGFAAEPPEGLPTVGSEKAVTTNPPRVVASVELLRIRRLHRSHADGDAGGPGRYEVAT
jgi:hypothetical protein